MKKKLHRFGHTVIEAKNGVEALIQMKNHDISCVFTDIRMPQMNGRELIKLLRKNFPNVTVFAVSGCIEKSTLEKDAKKYGIQGYLTKPLNHESFTEALKKIEEDEDADDELPAVA